MYYHFQTLIKFHCQLLLFRIKMVDQGHKPVNLGNSDFYEENHEQKSWNLFGRICNKSLLVFFLCQFFVIVLMLVCAIVRTMLTTTCEETTIWVAILSNTVGYILPSPKL